MCFSSEDNNMVNKPQNEDRLDQLICVKDGLRRQYFPDKEIVGQFFL